MEFFLDVDGVILDFELTFMDFVREKYLPDLPVDYIPTSWELNDGPLSQLDVGPVWEAFMSSGRFNHLNLLADAVTFNQLSDQYPVYLVTNLPHQHYEARVQNLSFHGLNYTSLHMGGHHDFGIENYPSKAQVIETLRSKSKQLLFLDDHPENCRGVKASFPEAKVYLMTRPHNLNIKDEDWVRVSDWAHFCQQVK